MNFGTKTIISAASFALSIAAGAAQSFAVTGGTTARVTTGARATSLGTSRNRTVGGTNALKLSVMNGSSVKAVKDITGSIYSKGVAQRYYAGNGRYAYRTVTTNLTNMLAEGFKIENELPPELKAQADAIEVKPWANDQPHVLDARVARKVASRLSGEAKSLVEHAERLQAKAEITDSALSHARDIAAYWEQAAAYFAENANLLEKNRVAVLVDE